MARVCAITTAKGRNLLCACYSLSLDALAQESGALLRPLIEVIELLTYFRLGQGSVDEALNGTLPTAGNRAQAIGGQFKFLRDHLNEDASHFAFGYYSVQHLLDKETFKIRPAQHQSFEVLERNLATLSAFFVFLLFESISCLFVAGSDANKLADRSEAWKSTSRTLFPDIMDKKS
jgi:hypothetical protein